MCAFLQSSVAGAVASLAEDKKVAKYAYLDSVHSFTPVAVETAGVFGPRALTFVKELGRRLIKISGDNRSRLYLFQRLTVAIQRGNAVSVLGTIGPSISANEVFEV